MLLTLLFAAINGFIAFFGKKLFRMQGWDIVPFSIVFLAWRGENIVIAALLLCLSYAFTSAKALRFLWFSFPLTIIVGLLSLIIPNMLLLILIYHAISLGIALVTSTFGPRYTMFMFTNLAMNILAWRLYAGF